MSQPLTQFPRRRTILPNRRPLFTVSTDWQGHPITVSVGYHPETGRPMEVFADTPQGGQMQAALSDACVWASIALQYGTPPEALAKSLAREPDLMGGERPASPLGVIAAVICGGAT